MYKTLLNTLLSLLVLAWIIPTISYTNWVALVVMAVILTILQQVIGPVFKLLLFPINLVTLGLTGFLINVAMLALADWLVPGFDIVATSIGSVDLGGFGTLVLLSVLLGLTQGLVGIVIRK